jgi:hypothetical protein
MRPSLKRLNHSLIWVTPIELSPKACWILRFVSASVSQNFQTELDAVSLLQVFCHLMRNETATNTCYTTLLSGGDRRIRRRREAAKIKHAHESPFYHTSQFLHPIAITYRGEKNIVGYFWTGHVVKIF